MANMPHFLKRSHIIEVIKDVERGRIEIPPNQKSREWCIETSDMPEVACTLYDHYPPKALVSLAYEKATGGDMPFFTPSEANPFLKDREFTVIRHGGAPH